MASFTLGSPNGEKVAVAVQRYERAVTADYYDDNWLVVRVEIKAGGFSGKFEASFLTSELLGFRDQLQRVYESLNGEAVFSTLEEQLSIRVTGNGLGAVEVKGLGADQPGIGNKLEFAFALDQTYLAAT